MTYVSGDDPQLLSDLRRALKRWHRPTLGEAALADGLSDVQRRLAAEPWLTRSKALRQSVLAGLADMKDKGRDQEAALLEQRYLREESMVLLAQAYGLSERSLYLRLHEAFVALAHRLWALEQSGSVASAEPLRPAQDSPSIWRARHLPPQTHSRLLGREEVLARLLDLLEDRQGSWIVSLDGMAGLGKTALAREAAGHLAASDRFADIAWITISPGSFTARGPQQLDLPNLTCGHVLDAIAHQIAGIDLAPLDLDLKRTRVRELLLGKAYLIVLDNLGAILDCRTLPDWFWDLANPSKLLLTSRHWLEADVGAAVIPVEQLGGLDSLTLVRHEARLRGLQDVAAAGDDALQRIVAVTGGNPLAIRLVVGQLVSLPLNRILTHLKTAQPNTDAFYQYLYATSWELVSGQAQQLLLNMVQLPANGGTWDELSALSDLSGNDLAASLEELVSRSLVQVRGFENMTYCLHPLTYHFAVSQAAQRTADT